MEDGESEKTPSDALRRNLKTKERLTRPIDFLDFTCYFCPALNHQLIDCPVQKKKKCDK